jgi:hypothetical protein
MQTTYYKAFRSRGFKPAHALDCARKAESYPHSAKHPIYNPATELYGSENCRWVENVAEGLRLAGFCDDLTHYIQHKGWYADEDGSEVYRGVVYRLPHGKYVYGYADPNNDGCALLCFDDIRTCEIDAAHGANRFAELAAESEREYKEVFQAGVNCRHAELKALEARTELKSFLASVKEMRKATAPDGPICRAIADRVQRLKETIAESRARALELREYNEHKETFLDGYANA